MSKRYWPQIKAAAEKHGLNPELVYAVCVKESSLDTWAMRFEPGWRWWLDPRSWARRVGVTSRTEEIAQACSWGLMQCMGAVSRERGHTGDIPQLCKPEIGLDFGCAHLAMLIKRHECVHKALSAYNTGRPNTKTGRAYADHVLSLMSDATQN